MSRKTNTTTPVVSSDLSTRLLQTAYSHYGNVMHVESGDAKSAQGIKRVFTAALLSTASFIATTAITADDANAACVGTTLIVCSGTTNSPQEFDVDDATVIVQAGATVSTVVYGSISPGDSTAVNLTAEYGDATIINYGNVISGSESTSSQNHGLHAETYDSRASVTNYGNVTTYEGSSFGLYADSSSNDDYGSTYATNHGAINTYGYSSTAIVTNAFNGFSQAINAEDGTVNVRGDGADGIMAFATGESQHAYAANYGYIAASGDSEDGFSTGNWLNEYGPDLRAEGTDRLVIGVGAIGHYANAGNYEDGSIITSGSGSIGIAARADSYALADNTGSITSGENDEDSYNMGVVAFTAEGGTAAAAHNSGTVKVYGDHSVGVFAYGEFEAAATAANYNGGSITLGSSENEDGDYAVGLLAVSGFDAQAINGAGDSEGGTASIVTWGDNSIGVAALSQFGGEAITYGEDGSVSSRDGGATAINAVNGSVISMGDYSFGVVASSSIDKYAHAVNAGTIATYGNGSIGLVAIGSSFSTLNYNLGEILNPLSAVDVGLFDSDEGGDNLILAENSGTIVTHGDYSDAVVARSKYAPVTVNNSGDVTTYGTNSMGVRAQSKYGTVTVNNMAGGTITTTGEGSYGIHATSSNYNSSEGGEDGVTIINAGTITTSGDYAAGIYAVADRGSVSVTNTATGVITVNADIGPMGGPSFDNGTAVYIAAGNEEGEDAYANFTNAGEVNGQVYVYGYAGTTVSNSGSISGDVIVSSEGGESVVTNNGGVITGALFVYGNSEVTVSGTGNSIGHGIHGNDRRRPASIEPEFISYNATLDFNQTDTMTFTDGVRGYAISGFNTVNFNSGTTIFDSSDSEDGVGISVVSSYSAPDSIHPDIPSFVPGTINVGGVNAATLGFTGSNETYVYAGTTNVLNHGTLSVAAGSSVLFSGDVAFANGGRFTVGLGNGGSHGLLQASTIDFAEGAYVNVNVTSGVDLTNGAVTVVALGESEDGSVTIADGVGVGGMRVTDNSILFNFLTAQNAAKTDLELVTQRSLTIEQLEIDTGGGATRESVGAALDEFIANLPNDNPIVIYLSQFETLEEQQAALKQLVQDTIPDDSGATTQGTIATTDLVFDLIMDRLSGGGPTVASNENGRTGMSAGDIELGGEGQWAIWGRAGASRSEFTPSSVNGFDANTWGITLGLDGGLADNVRGGFAFFHQNAQVKENGTGGNGGEDIKGNGGIAYMTWRPDPWYVNGSVGFGASSYDSRRSSLGALNTASFDGTQYVARLEFGRDFKSGGWKFTPNGGLRYSHVKTDGYTETGPLPLTVGGSSINSVRGVAGLNVSYRNELESGSVLIPEASVEVINEFANPNQPITATVIGGGTFITTPNSRKDLSFGASAGVTYEASDSLSVRLMYKGEYGKDYIDNGVQLAVRFAF